MVESQHLFATRKLVANKVIAKDPIRRSVAAVSVGIVDGAVFLDLDYEEDSKAEVDMNVVATGEGTLVEVQGTAEGKPFTKADLERMLTVAMGGIAKLKVAQDHALK